MLNHLSQARYDKKAKADKNKPQANLSPYKAAQGANKPTTSPFQQKKPGK